jgi:hypothetical protein
MRTILRVVGAIERLYYRCTVINLLMTWRHTFLVGVGFLEGKTKRNLPDSRVPSCADPAKACR